MAWLQNMYDLHLFQAELYINLVGRQSVVLYTQHDTIENTLCTHHITMQSLATQLTQKILCDRVEVFLPALKILRNAEDSNRVWLKTYLIHKGNCFNGNTADTLAVLGALTDGLLRMSYKLMFVIGEKRSQGILAHLNRKNRNYCCTHLEVHYFIKKKTQRSTCNRKTISGFMVTT